MSFLTLHILNGDATLNVFNETHIVGDVLVWREILSEGPVSKINLWETREKWICETFGESKDNFKQKVILEVEKLQNVADYDGIILWFEYDLVCQINLIFILSILNLNHNKIPIYLICPDKIEGMPNFRGLGELHCSVLKKLLPIKIRLQKVDLDLASKAWGLYVENDPLKIERFLENDFGNLTLIKKAFQAHLLRYPKLNTLNYIDEVLLAFIAKGITRKSEIYAAFWAQESIFGMTDLQIDLTLNKLKDKGLIAKGIC